MTVMILFLHTHIQRFIQLFCTMTGFLFHFYVENDYTGDLVEL